MPRLALRRYIALGPARRKSLCTCGRRRCPTNYETSARDADWIIAVANRHFGKIGDVWKHLPLAEILAARSPARYMDSHAGSALYPLSRSLSRDYGVFWFFERSRQCPVLRETAYHRLLTQMQDGAGQLTEYPGSPAIAMRLLGERAAYLFCDTDGVSLDDIQADAGRLAIPGRCVRCVRGDGVTSIEEHWDEVIASPERTLMHVDPYEPAAGPVGSRPIDLVAKAAAAGVSVVLWYGYHARDAGGPHGHDGALRDGLLDELRASFQANRVDPTSRVWFCELELEGIDDPRFDLAAPGALGCGICCVNVDGSVTDRMRSLGVAMADIYQGYRFPDGSSGTIRFDSTPSRPAAQSGGRSLPA